MTKFLTLKNAIAEIVKNGDTVALEGFTHLIPFAAGHEIIRQKLRDLTLIRMTPDLIYDQLVGAGCAKKLFFSWGGNPGVGSLHRVRDAIEHSYPCALEITEHSHAAMANAYEAGAAGLPLAVFRGYIGSELPLANKDISSITCPFTGEKLAAIPSIKPDVSIIHAQKADREGNVLIEGIIGVQKEVVLSAKRSIVTVEEIVDNLEVTPNACVLPAWAIDVVAVAPQGAKPSYALGYYDRDNSYYKEWDAISRNRETFNEWLQSHVLTQGDI
ncbi:3-oxoadipate:succinyl-CoA transferase subunit A [Marinomonas ushuaiensis DSM 15871]|uniref:3-oxoadipate:succinyl-CoA transferase subunit A n=1 Tax=Marinomonas ushuaiensis DSM 15871 TaxID=1122207 RepID=X7E129_9GAMM|nr:CoA transferase subunit A [Marinomonas ushuaiensis]ETX09784.1 3-oxoadipate:succinyl-CoA transferase subunit A [Marinomonas ushuaiensis DSM 15871]